MAETPDPITAEELEAAGLYDPAADDAGDRLALLQFVAGLGASMEELIESRNELPLLASMLPLRLGRERLTLGEVAERSGLPAEAVVRSWRAAGLPEPDPDVCFFSEVEADLLAGLQAAEALMGRETVLQLTRVMGAAMSRTADAMVSAFMVNLGGPSLARDASGLALARANVDAVALVPEAVRFLDVLLRRHIEAVRRPLGGDQTGTAGYETQPLAVGFADLVGSTALAQRLSIAQLGTVISDFETMALDVVTGQGGRLVKLIGDEVMFVVAEATNACEIGLALADLVAAHAVLPALRVGISTGDVLSRDGDYYGPVVNLAARATKVCEPGAVLVSADLRAAVNRTAPADYAFDSIGLQRLRGFDSPVELHAVRRSGTPRAPTA